MKLATYISMALALSACGRGLNGGIGQRGIFEPYFQTFEIQSQIHNRSIYGDAYVSIEYGSMSGPDVIGQCDIDPVNGRRIYVDADAWALLSEISRTNLISHELGHCLLNRQHNNNVFFLDNQFYVDPFAPVSIMNATLIQDVDFLADSTHYWDELFK